MVLATAQLHALLDEVLSPTPDYYKFWLTKDQRQRVEDVVQRILSTKKKPRSALFKWKAAVSASRFITKTQIVRSRKRSYEQSIASLCCGLCTETEMTAFLAGDTDEEMVEDVDEAWNDGILNEDDSCFQSFSFMHLSLDSIINDIPKSKSTSRSLSPLPFPLEPRDDSPKDFSVVSETGDSSTPPSPTDYASPQPLNEFSRTMNNSHIIPIDRENLLVRLKSDSETDTKPPLIEIKGQPSSMHNLIIPTEKDVIFGRGAVANNHAGNINFRKWVDELKPHYLATNGYKEKTKLSLTVINRVRKNGGRFLVEDSKTKEWAEADLKVIKNKCTQRFREQQKKKKTRGRG